MQEKIKSYIMKMQNASAPVKAAFWFTVCSIINKCIREYEKISVNKILL